MEKPFRGVRKRAAAAPPLHAVSHRGIVAPVAAAQTGARSIALDRFPEPHAERIDAAAEEQIALLQEIITAARNIRAEMKLDQKAKISAQLAPASRFRTIHRGTKPRYDSAAGKSLFPVRLRSRPLIPQRESSAPPRISNCSSRMRQPFDVQAEVARLRKELERLTKDIASKQQRLEDQTFRSRAPEHIVKGLETTLAERRDRVR